MNKEAKIKKLEEIIGYSFKEEGLIKEALTHRSYLNEKPNWTSSHNERLEFLGDAVLELTVTKYLFAKFPEEPEGKLTSIRAALVNYLMLSKVAFEINLGEFIFMSKGEEKSEGRARGTILANAVEALMGAIYLDGGFGEAIEFTDKFILPHLSEVMEKELYRDAKSQLQEVVQEKYKVTPTYEVVGEEGPDHDKVFKVVVCRGSKKIGEGEGPSKQEAETEAAKQALKKITNDK